MAYDKEEISKAFGGLSRDIEKFARINIGRKRKRRGRRGSYNSPIDSTGRLRKGFKIKDSITSGLSAQLELVLDNKVKDYFFVVNDGRRKGAKQPPMEAILEWIRKKPIRMRGSDGKFIRMTDTKQRQLAYLIGRSMAKHGTKPTHFFDEAVEQAFEKHESKIIEAYFVTADNLVEFLFKKHLKQFENKGD